MPALDAVVFDMDGTLFASHGPNVAALQAAVVAAGLPGPTEATVVAAYAAGPAPLLLGRLLGRIATTDELEVYYDALAERADGIAVYDGIRALLAEATVPLGIFTGASVRAAQILLTAAGLRDRFAVVVGGDQIERQKPDPDGLRRACGALGAAPARAAFVGDSPVDLGAAHAAGALAVAAGWGHQHDDAAPADLVAHRPQDLVGLVRGDR